ncbi:hypothetical protein TrRE_jg10499 [Triparma retinervis]|uniref:Uncharacterized protein n=1 Tax=Triparma retinervis TaxID=2557542 RepID=A0A9W6ZK34_9STRA|nr:hypothetical protein TrRE_jg10499 [Triparma retinervis]
MALKLAQKAAEKNLQNPVVALYRSMAKEVPKLEETLMQWKQKAQLMRLFEGVENTWRSEVVTSTSAPKTMAEEFEAIKGKVDTNDYGFESKGSVEGVIQKVGKGGVRVL